MYGSIEKSAGQTCAAKVVCLNGGEGRTMLQLDFSKIYDAG